MRFKPLIAIALFLSLSIAAHAHPGRTDSSGGHTDHSTGEYHYHHGYPAHQHSDTDGDGILDCPYRQTAIITKPREETTSPSSEIETPKIEEEQTKEPTNPGEQKSKTSKEIPTWLIGAAVLGVSFGGGFVVDALKRKK